MVSGYTVLNFRPCNFFVLSNFSRYLLVLRNRSSFYCLNCSLSSIFCNVLVDNLWISCKKKKSQNLPPGADHERKIKVAGLLGQRFLAKIQNGGRRFTLDGTWMSRVKKFVQQFFFGFNWSQSCLATHVTPQNCTKMLSRTTFEQLSWQKATFDCFLSKFRAPFWGITGKLFEKSRATWGKPKAGSQGTVQNCAA